MLMEVRIRNLISVLQLANNDTGMDSNSFRKEQNSLLRIEWPYTNDEAIQFRFSNQKFRCGGVSPNLFRWKLALTLKSFCKLNINSNFVVTI